ncbi:MAG: hypothetical protein LBJ45_01275 [Holosporaceae bacterium]|nr:hypothetical protein [Holosporaceae bacterium]
MWQCLAEGDLFWEIHKVKIKQSDENSFYAKQKALANALRSAFRKLVVEKLNADSQIAEKISNAQIQECIYDYSIENEKYSDSFYIAELSYRFSREKVSLLLESRGVILNVPKKNYSEKIKIVLRSRDFLQNIAMLRKLDFFVELFSGEKVVFSMDKKNIYAFRKLRIRYAQLQ